MSGATEIKRPVAATVIAAFVGHTVDGLAGGKLLLDAPPATVLSAAVASSTGIAVLYMPMYARPFFNTMTDELIEAPVIEKAKVTRS
jgi:hypothetical protein